MKAAWETIKEELLGCNPRPAKYLTPIKELTKKTQLTDEDKKHRLGEGHRRSVGSGKEIRGNSQGGVRVSL